jgi:hypothetical protein
MRAPRAARTIDLKSPHQSGGFVLTVSAVSTGLDTLDTRTALDLVAPLAFSPKGVVAVEIELGRERSL